MGDMGSMCCCYPNGFDVYGQISIGAFISTAQDITVTTQLVGDNWFVDYATRANVLGAAADGAATPDEHSTAIAPPMTKPGSKPVAPSSGFNLGNYLRTSLNTAAGLVLWLGEWAEMEFYVDGLGYSLRKVTGGTETPVITITDADLAGDVVAQYTAESTDGSLIVPGWVNADLAFDATRMYFNPTYWVPGDSNVFPLVEYFNLSTGLTLTPSAEGSIGIGMIGGNFVSDYDTTGILLSGNLRYGDAPYYAKTSFLATDDPAYYENSHIPPWSSVEGTTVLPENWQTLWDEWGNPYATYIAKDDPTTAFGYGVDATIHEEAEQTLPAGPSNVAVYTDQNWVTAYSRSLVLGTPGADGIVSGSTVWESGAWELIETGTPPFETRTWYGMTAAALECDSYGSTKAGIYFATATSFDGAKGDRRIERIQPDTYTNPSNPSETWPPSAVEFWDYNNLPGMYPGDFGEIDDFVDQLNNGSLTRSAGEAKVGVARGTSTLFSRPLYHCGWLPCSVRVAHDGTGDLFILERYRAGGISPYSDSAVVGTSQHGLLVRDAPASTERSLTFPTNGGNRVALVAGYGASLSSVRVATTGGSSGSHTVLQSGTVNGWDYQLIQADTTATTARTVRGTLDGDGILGIAVIENNVASVGYSTYTVGTVAGTPSAPPAGYAAAQVCFAAAPDSESVQRSKIQLSGSGRVVRTATDDFDGNRVQGMTTGFTHVWDGTIDNAWTFGAGVAGTIGFTILTALPTDSGWNGGQDWSLPTQAPSLHSGHGTRLRRVTGAGVTKWVLRNLTDDIGRITMACSDELVVVPAPLGGDLMIAVDAVTGEARKFNYPEGSGADGWFRSYNEPLLRWSFVPVADEMSTQGLAAWIAAETVGHGLL